MVNGTQSDDSEHYSIIYNIKFNKKENKYKILHSRDFDLKNAKLYQKLFYWIIQLSIYNFYKYS